MKPDSSAPPASEATAIEVARIQKEAAVEVAKIAADSNRHAALSGLFGLITAALVAAVASTLTTCATIRLSENKLNSLQVKADALEQRQNRDIVRAFSTAQALVELGAAVPLKDHIYKVYLDQNLAYWQRLYDAIPLAERAAIEKDLPR